MKTGLLIGCLTIASVAQAQEILDHVGEALTFSALNDTVRARFSGTIDLEGYHFEQPTPGLIDSDGDFLFNPRLTLFLDAQAGSNVYAFVQARFDRGFDPTDHGPQIRLDEYALRVTPWQNGIVSLQLGKFATVVGSYAPRHLSWENPFITAPLLYENLTALQDSYGYLVQHYDAALAYDKYELIPVVWGPSYATGVSLSGRVGSFDYAAEIKNRSLSSRPETWDLNRVGFENPTYSARLGWRPNQMWNFGLSLSDGAYLMPSASHVLPPGKDVGDFREQVLAQDISFAWHHMQFWAEVYEARFDIPRLGNAGTVAWYLEAKYKFAPQFFAALRWNQQFFGTTDEPGSVPLGPDLFRVDASAAYRFTEHSQFKVQYSYQHQTSGNGEDNHLLAAQFTVRF